MKSPFLQSVHHAFAQTDGTYKFPNSLEGDMLRQAKREIEALRGVLEHIVKEVNDEEDAGAFARYLAQRALHRVS